MAGMRDDLTAIYYTAHQEDPRTEEAVREQHLQSAGGIPIISVTQKPLDFGRNICVGTEVGISDLNAFRQYQIGVMEAKTKYVCPIEADVVYPPEYFQVVPESDDSMQMVLPMWVLCAMRGKVRNFCRKSRRGSESCLVADRDYVLAVFRDMLDDCPEWSDGHPFKHMYSVCKRRTTHIANPVVTFKTDYNMGHKTPHQIHNWCLELP
jgi:hypothetical protein